MVLYTKSFTEYHKLRLVKRFMEYQMFESLSGRLEAIYKKLKGSAYLFLNFFKDFDES